ncbi:uncharacterized protein LOC126761867 [Bactrocera neohumeralis]|uniref:uncharacterized protein LOC126761867 n=1 Tax=Bactrocera neohumeralis TaxID=98809 RepID=UPI002165ABBF|nr:uncharacterized protein LOC126761867 [Bactrocera neohumeralis]
METHKTEQATTSAVSIEAAANQTPSAATRHLPHNNPTFQLPLSEALKEAARIQEFRGDNTYDVTSFINEVELFIDLFAASNSLALDESTDMSDTAQLAVFVRGVSEDYTVIEELLDLRSMKDTTTGQDIYEEVKSCIEKYELQTENLCGLTTDGAPAMTGKRNGFVALMRPFKTHWSYNTKSVV